MLQDFSGIAQIELIIFFNLSPNDSLIQINNM